MNTDSKNNDPGKSWQELVAHAGKSDPPRNLNILEGVHRAIADDGPLDSKATTDWVSELTSLIDFVWLKPALATIALGALLLGREATVAWTEISCALNLQLPILTNTF